MCGVGTRDPCTRIISVLTCIGFFLFVLHVVCCEFWAAAIFQQEVLAWEDVTWQRSRCTVLSAGVSCIEAHHGKLCSNGTIAGNETSDAMNSSVVFPLQRGAICPGTYFCAEEHQPCICNGEITYGPVLFDGYRYHGPVNNSVYSNGSAGHLCGVDQHGQQLPDPAPKQPKFCWCTPRFLQRFASPIAPGCVDAADVASFAKSATVESLTGKRFTPWALVREEHSSSIACAYEFGIPRPSTDFFETSGGQMEQKAQQAQLLVQHWAKDPKRPCWIRRPSEGRSPCSIALEAPGQLERRADDMKRLATEHLMLCVAFVASLLCLCCWIFSASARELEQPLLVST